MKQWWLTYHGSGEIEFEKEKWSFMLIIEDIEHLNDQVK